jgi:hypothetical protein
MSDGNIFRRLISPWVMFGAILVGLVLLFLSAFLLWLTRPGPQNPVGGTAVLNVIPFSTATPPPPTPTPSLTPQPSSPSDQVPTPPSGDLSTGDYVQITGTGGDGLRLRADPGLDGRVRFLALEAEVFRIEDGPVEADGYTWWLLQAPYDDAVRGWGVSNYLLLAQQPE